MVTSAPYKVHQHHIRRVIQLYMDIFYAYGSSIVGQSMDSMCWGEKVPVWSPKLSPGLGEKKLKQTLGVDRFSHHSSGLTQYPGTFAANVPMYKQIQLMKV